MNVWAVGVEPNFLWLFEQRALGPGLVIILVLLL